MRTTLLLAVFMLVLNACTSVDEAIESTLETQSPVTTATASAPATTQAAVPVPESPATTQPQTTTSTTQTPTTTSTTQAPTLRPATADPAPPPEDPITLAGPSAIGGSITAVVEGGQPVSVAPLQTMVDVTVDIEVLPTWYCGFFSTTCWYEFHATPAWDGTIGPVFTASTVQASATILFPTDGENMLYYITLAQTAS
jgi:hypothetical protein